jgi:glycosyltransferase involved in cell wall biosynthesis
VKIAIVVATYKRKDGKTPFYLKRALDSVFNQNHKDFIVLVIGDDYENESELLDIIKEYPTDKLDWYNFDESPERTRYKGGMKLWCCGGLTAFNFGAEKALECGFDYICYLDHDDYWKHNHLKAINGAIDKKNADWICTKSKYGRSMVYPEVKSLDYYVNFFPLSGGIIKSSVCFNHRKIPLRFVDTFKDRGISIPSDADLWTRMAKYMKENNLKGILVNEITCSHDEEGNTYL